MCLVKDHEREVEWVYRTRVSKKFICQTNNRHMLRMIIFGQFDITFMLTYIVEPIVIL